MEKQDVLGSNLTFTQQERANSVDVTAQTVFHIEHVGSFVQNADRSVVHGEVNSAHTLVKGVRDFVGQVEKLLPVSDLPANVQGQARAALEELKEAEAGEQPDEGRLHRGLSALKRALAPAGESLLRLAVDAAVSKFVGPAS